MSILKTNLSCFKQNGLYRFDDSLLNIFHQSEKEKKIIEAQSLERWGNKELFDRDRAAISDYVGGLSYRLNYFKYTGSVKPDDLYDDSFYKYMSEELTNAMDKIPSTEGTFYRQVGFGRTDSDHFNSSIDDFLKFAKLHEDNVGGIISYPNFLSTTLVESSYKTHSPYTGLFMINGKNGKIIDNYSEHRKEYEALFAPNTKFKVEDFDWVAKNIFASILTEVE